jgi:hypothetical protein
MRSARVALATTVLAIASTVVVVSGTASPGQACSCLGPIATVDALGQAPVAFVGTARLGGEQDRTLTYVVDIAEAITGEVAATVDVTTASDEAACGTEVPTGVEVGFIPSVVMVDMRPTYSVGLCGGLVPAADLRAAAASSTSAPDGTGPVGAIAAARSGPASLVVLDREGQRLGAVVVPAAGSSSITVGNGVDACPGGELATATVARWGHPLGGSSLALVDLRRLEVVDEFPLDGDTAFWQRFDCIGPDGTTLLFNDERNTVSGSTEAVVITPGGADMLDIEFGSGEPVDVGALPATAPRWLAIAFSDRITWVPAPGTVAPDVDRIDIPSPPGFRFSSLAPSDDGFVAAVTSQPAWDGESVWFESAERLVTYDVDGTPRDDVLLDPIVRTPQLRAGARGFVIHGREDGSSTWFLDGSPIEVGSLGSVLTPIGDGVVRWNPFLPGDTSFLTGDADAPVLRDVSDLRNLVAVIDGVEVDPAATGAEPLPIVSTPGSIVDAPPTTSGTTLSTGETTPPDTVVTPGPATTVVGAGSVPDERDLTVWIAIAVLVGVSLVWLAATFARRGSPLPRHAASRRPRFPRDDPDPDEP